MRLEGKDHCWQWRSGTSAETRILAMVSIRTQHQQIPGDRDKIGQRQLKIPILMIAVYKRTRLAFNPILVGVLVNHFFLRGALVFVT